MSLLDTASLIVTPNGYKEGKLYSVIPSDGSGDLSVTRATTATRVNSAGLVELVPYNLVQYSQEFDNAWWLKYQATITANATTAPDGTSSAESITNTLNAVASVYKTGITNFGTNTISCYFKKGTYNYVFLELGGNSYNFCSFNIATGTVEVISGFSNVTIEDAGNGWYRCYATASDTAAVITIGYGTAGSPTAGDVTYIWGAQLVEGSVAKDYQKTETRLNIPRLDYSNGTCPSILVEPQRTNISQYVESGSGGWATGTISSASNILGLKAFNVLNNYGLYGDAAYILSNAGFAANTPYTLSFYTDFDQCTGTDVSISFLGFAPSLAYAGINVNKATKAITTFNVGGVFTLNSYEAIQMSGEIYKIVVTATPNASASGSRNYIGTGSDATSAVFAGVQLEAGSYATSYIQKTTGGSVTRNADVISKTGISSLIGQTEGTIFIDANISVRDTTRVLLDMQDGTNNDTFQFVLGGNTLVLNIYDSGVLQASLNGGYCLGHKKIALGYKANDFVLYIDGVQVATDTSGSVPTASLIALGYLYIASGYELGDSINATALWKTRLTNTQLAQLTTI